MKLKKSGKRVKPPEWIILGQRMKMARDARGYNQLDCCDEVNLKRRKTNPEAPRLDPKTLSKWENGHNKIALDNLHFLASALEIPYEEEIYWSGLAGYIKPTPLPTKQQITSILEVYYQEIQRHPYPAIIIDYRNNLWAINPAAAVFVGSYEVAANLLKERMFNLFELFFNTRYFGPDIAEIDGLHRRQIILFLMTNLYRRHEPFWQRYPKCWDGQLTPPDYRRFEIMWNDVCAKYLDSFTSSERFVREVTKYSYVTFQTPTGIPIQFKVMAETPSYFYNNFFQVLYYVLDNDEDKQEAENFFKSFQGKDTSKLKEWKLRDVDEILAGFV